MNIRMPLFVFRVLWLFFFTSSYSLISHFSLVWGSDLNDVKINLHVLEVDGIYTISVLAQNTTPDRMDLDFGVGAHADFELLSILDKKKTNWSDQAQVFSLTKTITLEANQTRVISNFSHVDLKVSGVYQVRAKAYVLDQKKKPQMLESPPLMFEIKKDGRVLYAKSKAPLSGLDIAKRTAQTERKPKDSVFIFEGPGGTNWSPPQTQERISPPLPYGAQDISSLPLEDPQDLLSESEPESESEPDITDRDATDTPPASSETGDTDTADTPTVIPVVQSLTDSTSGEEESSSDESSVSDTDEEENTSGGGGGGSGGSIWQNDTVPLLWTPSGNIIYVSDRIGSNSFSGTTEGAPFKSISHALTRAADHDLILMGPGIYDEGGLNIVKEIELRGSEGAHKTILKNTSTNNRIVTVQANAVLSGLTFSDHNATDSSGGGLLVLNNAQIQLNRCRVMNNIGKNGSAIQLTSNCSIQIRDTLISDNLAKEINIGDGFGGGIYLEGNNTVLLESVTLVDNFAENQTGGLYISGSGVSLEIVNSIIWGNRDEIPANSVLISNMNSQTQSNLTIDHSCFEGALPTGFLTVSNNGGNITSDPAFSNQFTRDYRLGFSPEGNLSGCVNTGARLEIGANGNEDDMGCFPAFVVTASADLRNRLDNFGEYNADMQMGVSLLLSALRYTALGNTGAESYQLINSDVTSRNFHRILISGSGVDSVVIEGLNDFSSLSSSTFTCQNISITLKYLTFVNTRMVLQYENSDRWNHEVRIENCVADLGQEQENTYQYLENGSLIASTSGLSSATRLTIKNTTIVHGKNSGSEAVLYMNDTDESDTLQYVNNADILRDESGFVTADWNALSMENISSLSALINNNTWPRTGLIVNRKDSPQTTRSFVARESESSQTSRDNLEIDPGFKNLVERNYHLKLGISDLIDTGVERKMIRTFTTAGSDRVTIDDMRFSTEDLSVGDKVKLVNPTDKVEEFTVISAVDRTDTGFDTLTFRNELEHNYTNADKSYIVVDFSRFALELEDNGDTVNIGAFGNTNLATKSSGS